MVKKKIGVGDLTGTGPRDAWRGLKSTARAYMLALPCRPTSRPISAWLLHALLPFAAMALVDLIWYLTSIINRLSSSCVSLSLCLSCPQAAAAATMSQQDPGFHSSYDSADLLRDPSAVDPVKVDLSTVSEPVRNILNQSSFARLCQTAPALPTEALRALISSVHNSTHHLERSNRELKAAQEECAAQGNAEEAEEYEQFIRDNLHVIEANGIRVGVIETVIRSRTEGSSTVHANGKAQTKENIVSNDDGSDSEGVYL